MIGRNFGSSEGRPSCSSKGPEQAVHHQGGVLKALSLPYKRHDRATLNGFVGIRLYFKVGIFQKSCENKVAVAKFLTPVVVDGSPWKGFMVAKVFSVERKAFEHGKRSVLNKMNEAKFHVKVPMQAKIQADGIEDSFSITIHKQPANLPDFNGLELFFYSL